MNGIPKIYRIVGRYLNRSHAKLIFKRKTIKWQNIHQKHQMVVLPKQHLLKGLHQANQQEAPELLENAQEPELVGPLLVALLKHVLIREAQELLMARQSKKVQAHIRLKMVLHNWQN